MALQLVKTDVFALTVPVTIPTDDPKKPITGSFTAKFKYRNREQREELVQQMQDGQMKDAEFFESDVVSISGIAGEGGEELTPAQQKQAVMERMELCQAMFAAYWDHVTGAAAKNLKASPRR
mgnify:FL=1